MTSILTAITPFSRAAVGDVIASRAFAAPTDMTWIGAGTRGVFWPVVLQESVLVKKLFWSNGAVVSGNVDVGIYDEAQKLLVNAGSTAQAGTSVIQEVDVTDTQIPAGRAFVGMAVDNTTGQVFGLNPGATLLRALGFYIQGSVIPMPATGTWASPGANNAVIPVAGFLCGPVP